MLAPSAEVEVGAFCWTRQCSRCPMRVLGEPGEHPDDELNAQPGDRRSTGIHSRPFILVWSETFRRTSRSSHLTDRSPTMKLGCLLPILAIGFVVVGAQGLYVGLTNRTLTTMTYQEFLQKKPSSGWVEVSDARLNLLTAIHESNRFTGTIKKVYLPVGSSAAGEHVGDDNKIHLLLVTEDETILKTVKDLESATGGGGGLMGRLNRRIEANRKPEAKKNEPPAKDDALENALHFMAENADKVLVNRPVRGLLQFGLDSDSRDRQKIQALDPDIAADFAVLEDGEQPQLAASVFMIIAGIGLAGLLIRRARRAGPPDQADSGSAGASAPPGAPQG